MTNRNGAAMKNIEKKTGKSVLFGELLALRKWLLNVSLGIIMYGGISPL